MKMAKQRGYRQVYCGGHPRASASGMVKEHILIAEKALGHYLPEGAQVHHVDEDTWNNRNNNLVICENQKYHRLLHVMQRVRRAGGNPFLDRVCYACRVAKPMVEFSVGCGECRPCHCVSEKRNRLMRLARRRDQRMVA